MSWHAHASMADAHRALSLGRTAHGFPVACLLHTQLPEADVESAQTATFEPTDVFGVHHAIMPVHVHGSMHAAWACIAIAIASAEQEQPMRLFVWGYVPMALVLQRDGAVDRADAVPAPLERRPCLTAPHVGLFGSDAAGRVTVEEGLLPRGVSHDHAVLAVSRRLGWHNPVDARRGADAVEGATDAELGALGYMLTLVAAVRQNKVHRNTPQDASVDWAANERALVERSLVWHGGHARLVILLLGGECASDGAGDADEDRGTLSAPLETCLALLPAWRTTPPARLAWRMATTRLVGGRIYAPAAAWTCVLLERLNNERGAGRANTVGARASRLHSRDRDVFLARVWQNQRDAAWLARLPAWFGGLLDDTLEWLSHRMQQREVPLRRAPGTGLARARSAAEMGVIGLVELVDVMPPCMAQLHERATMPGAAHLKHQERLTYTNFMIGCGVSVDDFINIQYDMIVDEFGFKQGKKRIQSEIRPMIQGQVKWLARQKGTKTYGAMGCVKQTIAQGDAFCPHFIRTKLEFAADMSHAEGRCSQAQATLMGLKKPALATGLMIGYAMQFRSLLATRATARLDVHHNPSAMDAYMGY